MPDKKTLKLRTYGISKNKYRELKYFCMQYYEKKEMLKSLCEVSAITYSGMPHGSGVGNPTEQQAALILSIKKDIELIEQTAIETDADFYQQLIDNVGNEIQYEFLDLPYSRRQFYRIKRKFFYLLSLKRWHQ